MQDRATSVAIVGAGVITAAGNSLRELRAAVVEGKLCAEEITAFEPSEGEPTWGCECAEFVLTDFVSSAKGYNDRTSAMLLASGAMALREAKLIEDGSKCELEVGLSYGSEWGCLDSMEVFYSKLRDKPARFAPPLPFSHSYVNSSASVMAIQFGLKGHHVVYSNGANSGGLALMGAIDGIALGRAKCIVAASSDSFSRAAFRHYHSNNLLAPTPSDIAPNQFMLSEGSASFVLCSEDTLCESAEVLGRLKSVSVATGISASEALQMAIKDATQRAGVNSCEIAEVITLGASSEIEKAESEAAGQILGAEDLSVYNLGSALGYTMGPGMMLGVAATLAGEQGTHALVVSSGIDNMPSTQTTAVAALISVGS